MNIIDKPRQCKLCTKIFTYPSELYKHQLTHTKEKPYSCSVCSKNFTHVGSLNRHKGYHSRVEAHKCKQCDYSCSILSNFFKHMQTHRPSKGAKYSCDKCDYETSEKGPFRRHQSTVHVDIKDYQCVECNFKTSRIDSFRRHYQLKHDALVPLAYLERTVDVNTDTPSTFDKNIYSCYVCNFQTSKKDLLGTMHLFIHSLSTKHLPIH